MSERPEKRSGEQSEEPEVTDEERARRRSRVFGEVLPEATDRRDESDRPDEQRDRGDDWLRANVPPHHGG